MIAFLNMCVHIVYYEKREQTTAVFPVYEIERAYSRVPKASQGHDAWRGNRYGDGEPGGIYRKL